MADEQMQRRVVAQNLFNAALGPGGRQRLGPDTLLQHCAHPVAKAVHRGLMPRVQQQDAG